MVEVAGPTDGCPSGGSSQKQPKTGPRALALNGLALWTRANSWRGPRPPRPAYTMCEHWDTSAVDTTDATLFGSNAYYPRELQHYWRSNPADDQDWLFIQICNRRAQRFSIITSPTEQWRCEIRQNRPFVNRSDNNTCLDGIIYKKYSSEIKYLRTKSALSRFYRLDLMRVLSTMTSYFRNNFICMKSSRRPTVATPVMEYFVFASFFIFCRFDYANAISSSFSAKFGSVSPVEPRDINYWLTIKYA